MSRVETSITALKKTFCFDYVVDRLMEKNCRFPLFVSFPNHGVKIG